MQYLIAKPSPILSSYVKHYWTINNVSPAGKQHIQRIVPSGLLEMNFYFEDRPLASSKSKAINENTIISGQLNAYYDLTVTGKLSLFSILFRPEGLSGILNLPISELYNQSIPLKYIFKQDTNKIETELYEANSFRERTAIIENYLIDALSRKTTQQSHERIQQTVAIINQKKGFADINDLASAACYSRKQFERAFAKHVGISPKKFLKTIRFQHVVHEKSINPELSLTDLTYRCGYYDQSHMINDFQKLSGMTPGQYFRDCEAYSDYFQ